MLRHDGKRCQQKPHQRNVNHKTTISPSPIAIIAIIIIIIITILRPTTTNHHNPPQPNQKKQNTNTTNTPGAKSPPSKSCQTKLDSQNSQDSLFFWGGEKKIAPFSYKGQDVLRAVVRNFHQLKTRKQGWVERWGPRAEMDIWTWPRVNIEGNLCFLHLVEKKVLHPQLFASDVGAVMYHLEYASNHDFNWKNSTVGLVESTPPLWMKLYFHPNFKKIILRIPGFLFNPYRLIVI